MWKKIKEALFLKELNQSVKLLKAGYLFHCDQLEIQNDRNELALDAIVSLSLRIVELEKLIYKTKKNEVRKKSDSKRTNSNNNTGRKTLLRPKK